MYHALELAASSSERVGPITELSTHNLYELIFNMLPLVQLEYSTRVPFPGMRTASSG
jgi:hypothetical protein